MGGRALSGGAPAALVTRTQVLSWRVAAQQLDRDRGPVPDAAVLDTAVLDVGVQDTGPDGSRWALALRGLDVDGLDPRFALAWTVRGAPHLYRRADLPGVAASLRPWSEADAAKRIYDAAKPLRAAGIEIREAMGAVAGAMRTLVTEPMVKGDVSGRLTWMLDEPYRRDCRPCGAVHIYEMPFRLAALQAGLELQPGTSPPVLRPMPGFAAAAEVPQRLDLVRGYLRMLGPATPKAVATYLDAPVKDVQAHWPADAVPVEVDGDTRWLLAADVEPMQQASARLTRLLGPYDLFLQARDRELLVPDPARRAALWPVLGRPGAVLVDGEIVGTWRPRASGRRLRLEVELWGQVPERVRGELGAQAERLASFRGVGLSSPVVPCD